MAKEKEKILEEEKEEAKKEIKNRLIEFISYQLGKKSGFPSFNAALSEITKCRKTLDWIWYIIPSSIGTSENAQKFLINIQDNSPLMVSHYLMIPYLKNNYETIINEIYKCLDRNDILTILGKPIDVIKFKDSIKEFLTGYTEIYSKIKTQSDFTFINILDYLINHQHIKSRRTKLTKFSEYARVSNGTNKHTKTYNNGQRPRQRPR